MRPHWPQVRTNRTSNRPHREENWTTEPNYFMLWLTGRRSCAYVQQGSEGQVSEPFPSSRQLKCSGKRDQKIQLSAVVLSSDPVPGDTGQTGVQRDRR